MLQAGSERYYCGYPSTAPCFLSRAAGCSRFSMRKECYNRTEQELTEKYELKLFMILKYVINLKTRRLQKYKERIGACLSSFPDVRQGSLTIEAAIALPLFIFMMFILLFPIKVMEEERRLQNAAENVGRQLAAEQYVRSIGSELLNKDGDSREYLSAVVSGMEEGISLGVILAKALEMKSICIPYFDESTSVFAGDNKDMFRAELKYSIKLPFSAFVIPAPARSIVVNRRAWTGSDGGRGRSKYTLNGEDDADSDDDRIVYLGKTSTVYHDDPNCHYLSNVMKTADASHMGALRNDSGAKYHACPSCKPGKTGTVYYFENGTAYHSSEHCKAVTAYSRSVHLSEVSDMRACSYCGKAH